MAEPILSFQNVSFSYADMEVLKDVSFDIYEGEYVGFIGPNGGGKTTLFKLILGTLTPKSGKILFSKGKKRPNEHFISYVPQTIRYDKQFPITTLEVVMQGLLQYLPWYGKFSSSHVDMALSALQNVGLKDFASKQFGALSQGQAQRVLIARALVSSPKLLLLDEPTASVDAQSEAEIHEILSKLKNEITLLMVTHDISAIIKDVQRVICVQGDCDDTCAC